MAKAKFFHFLQVVELLSTFFFSLKINLLKQLNLENGTNLLLVVIITNGGEKIIIQ
jgi:hypothetical protein